MVRAALHEEHIGLPQRAIGGEFAGAAIDEGATGHHQLTGIAGHRRRHRLEIGPYRRAGLKRPTHRLQRFGGTETDRLDDIAAMGPRLGMDRIAQLSEHRGHQLGADQGLGHHLGGQKQALKQQAIAIKTGAALTADSRGREPAASPFHQLGPTRHIAAGGGDRAAEILDQGAGDQIRPNSRGLARLHQLAVAVVHEHQATRLQGLHPLHQPADRRHRQRGSPAVATAALDQHQPRGQSQGLLQSLLIDPPRGRQRQLVIEHTEFRQRTLALAPQTDHLLEGVVGASGERKQAIAWSQHAEQGGGDRVGAGDELQTHRRGFGLQHPGKDPVEGLATEVAMAVATHRGEVMHPHPLGGEGRQHPLQPRTDRGRAGGGQGGDALEGGGDPLGRRSRGQARHRQARKASIQHGRKHAECRSRSKERSVQSQRCSHNNAVATMQWRRCSANAITKSMQQIDALGATDKAPQLDKSPPHQL